MPLPRVAVIYLSFHCEQYIDRVVEHMEKVNYPRDRWELVIVDNLSPKGSSVPYLLEHVAPKAEEFELRGAPHPRPSPRLQCLAASNGGQASRGEGSEGLRESASSQRKSASLPKVTIIANSENRGFAGGNNDGMRYALEQGFDYLYLLNQDAYPGPDFISGAVEVAESDSQIGQIQSYIKLYPETDKVNTIGNELHYLGFGFCGGYRWQVARADKVIEEKRKTDPQLQIPYASGAGTLLRASALRTAGLFDEHMFLYHEDTDLTLRIKEAGYKVVLAPKSVIFHQYEFSRSIAKYYWMERNRIFVMLTHYKIRTLLVLFPAFLALEIVLSVAALRGGWFKEKIKVYKYYAHCTNWRRIIAKRREVQDARKISDKEILRNATAVIEFQDVENPALRWIVNPLMRMHWICARPLIQW